MNNKEELNKKDICKDIMISLKKNYTNNKIVLLSPTDSEVLYCFLHDWIKFIGDKSDIIADNSLNW